MKIVNINDKMGDAVEFDGNTLEDCLTEYQACVSDCGYEIVDPTEGVDYEIVGEPDDMELYPWDTEHVTHIEIDDSVMAD